MSDFERLVERKVKAGMTRARATAAAAKERPDLHRAYLAAYNEARGRTRVAAELRQQRGGAR